MSRKSAMSAEPLLFTVAPVEAVLRFAQRFPVFPCRRGPEHIVVNGEPRLLKAKSPLVPTGFKAATQDADQIRAWWARWPDALVGMPTGTITGLVVIDFDSTKADASTGDWVEEHVLALMGTRVHTTLSGGKHYLYRQPAGCEYRSGVSITLGGIVRKGLDVRAEGGYIIWWPLHGGESIGELAPLPAGLIDERKIEAHELSPLPTSSPDSWAKDKPRVAAALAYLDPSNYADWRDMGLAISLASGGSDDGLDLWHAWSSGEITGECPSSYSGFNDCRYHWDSYRHDKPREGMITLGSLFERAKAKGYQRPAPAPASAPPIEAYADEERAAIQEEPRVERKPLRIVSLEDLPTVTPVPTSFVAAPILPRKQVTLLGAHGDAGKSYLALAFAAHVACGAMFGEIQFVCGRALIVSLEDDGELVKWRLKAVAAAFELDIEAVAKRITVVEVLDDEDASLAFEGQGKELVFTAALEQIREMAPGHDFIVVDNASDAFDADEIKRRLVRRFIRRLRSIARHNNLALLLLAHIDKAGARSGTGGETYSGSTAWHNSVRSRLALLKADNGAISLVQEKSNLGLPMDSPIPLARNDQGVPVPLSRAEREQINGQHDREVLAAIRGAIASGITVPTAMSGPRTAMSVIASRPEISEELAANPRLIKASLMTLERQCVIWPETYVNSDHKKRQRYAAHGTTIVR